MAWDPNQGQSGNANSGSGSPPNPYETSPENPYATAGTVPENSYGTPQTPYGTAPENPYATPAYGYADTNYQPGASYIEPALNPLPLGEAIRNLPNQYIKVLTKPGAMTFAEEMGKASWDIVWVQLIGLAILYTLLGLLGFLISPNMTFTATGTGLSASSTAILQSFRSIILGITVAEIVLIPLFFFIGMGILYGLAKAFGGQGKFVTQSYAYLLFDVPLGIVSALVGLIPIAGTFIALGVLVYRIVLAIFSIMAVHRLSGGKASAVVLIPIAVVVLLYCGFIFALIAFFISRGSF